MKTVRQFPVFKRSPVSKGSWLSLKYRQIVPGIKDRFVPPEMAFMFRNQSAVADHPDLSRIGPYLYKPSSLRAHYAVAVSVKGDEASGRYARDML